MVKPILRRANHWLVRVVVDGHELTETFPIDDTECEAAINAAYEQAQHFLETRTAFRTTRCVTGHEHIYESLSIIKNRPYLYLRLRHNGTIQKTISLGRLRCTSPEFRRKFRKTPRYQEALSRLVAMKERINREAMV